MSSHHDQADIPAESTPSQQHSHTEDIYSDDLSLLLDVKPYVPLDIPRVRVDIPLHYLNSNSGPVMRYNVSAETTDDTNDTMSTVNDTLMSSDVNISNISSDFDDIDILRGPVRDKPSLPALPAHSATLDSPSPSISYDFSLSIQNNSLQTPYTPSIPQYTSSSGTHPSPVPFSSFSPQPRSSVPSSPSQHPIVDASLSSPFVSPISSPEVAKPRPYATQHTPQSPALSSDSIASPTSHLSSSTASPRPLASTSSPSYSSSPSRSLSRLARSRAPTSTDTANATTSTQTAPMHTAASSPSSVPAATPLTVAKPTGDAVRTDISVEMDNYEISDVGYDAPSTNAPVSVVKVVQGLADESILDLALAGYTGGKTNDDVINESFIPDKVTFNRNVQITEVTRDDSYTAQDFSTSENLDFSGSGEILRNDSPGEGYSEDDSAEYASSTTLRNTTILHQVPEDSRISSSGREIELHGNEKIPEFPPRESPFVDSWSSAEDGSFPTYSPDFSQRINEQSPENRNTSENTFSGSAEFPHPVPFALGTLDESVSVDWDLDKKAGKTIPDGNSDKSSYSGPVMGLSPNAKKPLSRRQATPAVVKTGKNVFRLVSVDFSHDSFQDMDHSFGNAPTPSPASRRSGAEQQSQLHMPTSSTSDAHVDTNTITAGTEATVAPAGHAGAAVGGTGESANHNEDDGVVGADDGDEGDGANSATTTMSASKLTSTHLPRATSVSRATAATQTPTAARNEDAALTTKTTSIGATTARSRTSINSPSSPQSSRITSQSPRMRSQSPNKPPFIPPGSTSSLSSASSPSHTRRARSPAYASTYVSPYSKEALAQSPSSPRTPARASTRTPSRSISASRMSPSRTTHPTTTTTSSTSPRAPPSSQSPAPSSSPPSSASSPSKAIDIFLPDVDTSITLSESRSPSPRNAVRNAVRSSGRVPSASRTPTTTSPITDNSVAIPATYADTHPPYAPTHSSLPRLPSSRASSPHTAASPVSPAPYAAPYPSIYPVQGVPALSPSSSPHHLHLHPQQHQHQYQHSPDAYPLSSSMHSHLLPSSSLPTAPTVAVAPVMPLTWELYSEVYSQLLFSQQQHQATHTALEALLSEHAAVLRDTTDSSQRAERLEAEVVVCGELIQGQRERIDVLEREAREREEETLLRKKEWEKQFSLLSEELLSLRHREETLSRDLATTLQQHTHISSAFTTISHHAATMRGACDRFAALTQVLLGCLRDHHLEHVVADRYAELQQLQAVVEEANAAISAATATTSTSTSSSAAPADTIAATSIATGGAGAVASEVASTDVGMGTSMGLGLGIGSVSTTVAALTRKYEAEIEDLREQLAFALSGKRSLQLEQTNGFPEDLLFRNPDSEENSRLAEQHSQAAHAAISSALAAQKEASALQKKLQHDQSVLIEQQNRVQTAEEALLAREEAMKEREAATAMGEHRLRVRVEDITVKEAEVEAQAIALKRQREAMLEKEVVLRSNEAESAARLTALKEREEELRVREEALMALRHALEERERVVEDKLHEVALRESSLEVAQEKLNERELVDEDDGLPADVSSEQEQENERQLLAGERNDLVKAWAELESAKAELEKEIENMAREKAEIEADNAALSHAVSELAEHEASLNARQSILDTREASLHTREDSLNAREAALHSQEVMLNTREEAVVMREEEVKTRTSALDGREDNLLARAHDIDRREEALETREQEVTVREEDVLARASALSLREEVIAAREIVLASTSTRHDEGLNTTDMHPPSTELEAAFTQREDALTEREHALQEREAAVAERELDLNQRERAVVERLRASEDREIELVERDRVLSERECRVTALTAAVSAREAVMASRDHLAVARGCMWINGGRGAATMDREAEREVEEDEDGEANGEDGEETMARMGKSSFWEKYDARISGEDISTPVQLVIKVLVDANAIIGDTHAGIAPYVTANAVADAADASMGDNSCLVSGNDNTTVTPISNTTTAAAKVAVKEASVQTSIATRSMSVGTTDLDTSTNTATSSSHQTSMSEAAVNTSTHMQDASVNTSTSIDAMFFPASPTTHAAVPTTTPTTTLTTTRTSASLSPHRRFSPIMRPISPVSRPFTPTPAEAMSTSLTTFGGEGVLAGGAMSGAEAVAAAAKYRALAGVLVARIAQLEEDLYTAMHARRDTQMDRAAATASGIDSANGNGRDMTTFTDSFGDKCTDGDADRVSGADVNSNDLADNMYKLSPSLSSLSPAFAPSNPFDLALYRLQEVLRDDEALDELLCDWQHTLMGYGNTTAHSTTMADVNVPHTNAAPAPANIDPASTSTPTSPSISTLRASAPPTLLAAVAHMCEDMRATETELAAAVQRTPSHQQPLPQHRHVSPQHTPHAAHAHTPSLPLCVLSTAAGDVTSSSAEDLVRGSSAANGGVDDHGNNDYGSAKVDIDHSGSGGVHKDRDDDRSEDDEADHIFGKDAYDTNSQINAIPDNTIHAATTTTTTTSTTSTTSTRPSTTPTSIFTSSSTSSPGLASTSTFSFPSASASVLDSLDRDAIIAEMRQLWRKNHTLTQSMRSATLEQAAMATRHQYEQEQARRAAEKLREEVRQLRLVIAQSEKAMKEMVKEDIYSTRSTRDTRDIGSQRGHNLVNSNTPANTTHTTTHTAAAVAPVTPDRSADGELVPLRIQLHTLTSEKDSLARALAHAEAREHAEREKRELQARELEERKAGQCEREVLEDEVRAWRMKVDVLERQVKRLQSRLIEVDRDNVAHDHDDNLDDGDDNHSKHTPSRSRMGMGMYVMDALSTISSIHRSESDLENEDSETDNIPDLGISENDDVRPFRAVWSDDLHPKGDNSHQKTKKGLSTLERERNELQLMVDRQKSVISRLDDKSSQLQARVDTLEKQLLQEKLKTLANTSNTATTATTHTASSASSPSSSSSPVDSADTSSPHSLSSTSPTSPPSSSSPSTSSSLHEEQLQQRIFTLEAQIFALELSLHQSTAAATASVADTVTALRERCHHSEQECVRLREVVAKKEKELSELSARCEALALQYEAEEQSQQQTEAVINSDAAPAIATLPVDTTAAAVIVTDTLATASVPLQTPSQSLAAQFLESQLALAQAQASLARAEATHTTLHTQYAHLKSQHTHLQTQLTAMQAENTQLRASHADLAGKYSQLEAQRAQEEREMTEYINTISAHLQSLRIQQQHALAPAPAPARAPETLRRAKGGKDSTARGGDSGSGSDNSVIDADGGGASRDFAFSLHDRTSVLLAASDSSALAVGVCGQCGRLCSCQTDLHMSFRTQDTTDASNGTTNARTRTRNNNTDADAELSTNSMMKKKKHKKRVKEDMSTILSLSDGPLDDTSQLLADLYNYDDISIVLEQGYRSRQAKAIVDRHLVDKNDKKTKKDQNDKYMNSLGNVSSLSYPDISHTSALDNPENPKIRKGKMTFSDAYALLKQVKNEYYKQRARADLLLTQYKALRKENSQLREKSRSDTIALSDLVRVNARVLELEAQLLSSETQLQRSRDDMANHNTAMASLQATVSDLTGALEQARAETAAVSAMHATLTDTHTQSLSEAVQLRQTVESLQQQLHRAREDMLAAQRLQVHAEREHANIKRDYAQTQRLFEDLEHTNAQLMRENETIMREKVDLDELLRERSRDYNACAATIDTLHARITSLERDLSQRNARVQELLAAMVINEEETAAMLSKITSLEQAVLEAQRAAAQTQAALEQARVDLSESTRASSAEVLTLKRERDALTLQLEAAQETRERQGGDMAVLQERLALAELTTQRLQARVDALQAEAQQQQRLAAKKDEKVQMMKQKLSEMTETHNALQHQLHQARARVEEREVALQSLQRAVDAAQREAKDATQALSSVRRQLSERTRRCEELDAVVADMEAAHVSALTTQRESLNKLRSDLSDASRRAARVDSLEDQLQTLRGDLATLQKQYAASQATVETLTTERTRLQQSLSSVQEHSMSKGIDREDFEAAVSAVVEARREEALLQAELVAVKEVNAVLESKMEEMQKLIVKKTEDNEGVYDRYVKLVDVHGRCSDVVSQLKAENNKLDLDIRNFQQREKHLREEISESQARIIRVEEELTRMRNRSTSEAEEQHMQSQARITALLRRVEEVEEEAEERRKALQERYTRKISDLEENVVEMSAKLRQCESEVQIKVKEIEILEKEVQRKEKTLKDLEKTLQEVENSGKTALENSEREFRKRLSETVESHSVALSASERRLHECNTRLTEVETTLEATSAHERELMTTVSTHLTTITAHEAVISTLREQTQSLRIEMASIQRDLTSATQQLTAREAEIEQRDASITHMRDEMVLMRGELETVLQQLDTTIAELTNAQDEHTTLEEQHSLLMDQFTTLTEQHGELTEEHNALVEQHSALTDEHSTLQETHAKLTEQYGGVCAELEEVQREYAALGGELGAVSDEYTALQGEHDVLRQRCNAIEEEYKTVKQECVVASEECEALKREYEAAKEECGKLRDEADQYRAETESRRVEAESRYVEAEARYRTAQEACEQLHEQCVVLRNTVSEVKMQYEQVKRAYEEMKQQYTSLESHLAEVMSKKSVADVDTHVQECARLQTTVEKLQNSVETLVDEKNGLLLRCEEAEGRARKREAAADAEESVRGDLESRYTATLKRLEDTVEENETLRSEMERLRVAMALESDKYRCESADREELRSKVEMADKKREELEKEIESKTEALMVLEGECGVLKRNRQEMVAELVSLQAKYNTLQVQLRDYNTILEKKDISLSDLQNRVSDFEKQVSDLQHQLTRALDTRVSSDDWVLAQQELIDVRAKYTELQTTHSAVQQRLQTSETTISSLHRDLAALRDEHVELQVTFNALHDRYTAYKTRSANERAELEREMEETVARVSEAQKRLEVKVQGEREQWETRLREEKERAQVQLDEERGEGTRIQARLQEERQHLLTHAAEAEKRWLAELQTLQQRISTLSEERDTLQVRVQSLEAEMSAGTVATPAAAELERVTADYARVAAELARVTAESSSAQTTIVELRQAMAVLEHRVSALIQQEGVVRVEREREREEKERLRGEYESVLQAKTKAVIALEYCERERTELVSKLQEQQQRLETLLAKQEVLEERYMRVRGDAEGLEQDKAKIMHEMHILLRDKDKEMASRQVEWENKVKDVEVRNQHLQQQIELLKGEIEFLRYQLNNIHAHTNTHGYSNSNAGSQGTGPSQAYVGDDLPLHRGDGGDNNEGNNGLLRTPIRGVNDNGEEVTVRVPFTPNLAIVAAHAMATAAKPQEPVNDTRMTPQRVRRSDNLMSPNTRAILQNSNLSTPMKERLAQNPSRVSKDSNDGRIRVIDDPVVDVSGLAALGKSNYASLRKQV